MFKKKPKDEILHKTQNPVKKNRHTQDELEILTVILNENPSIKQKVLEKIRVFRSLNSGKIKSEKDGEK